MKNFTKIIALTAIIASCTNQTFSMSGPQLLQMYNIFNTNISYLDSASENAQGYGIISTNSNAQTVYQLANTGLLSIFIPYNVDSSGLLTIPFNSNQLSIQKQLQMNLNTYLSQQSLKINNFDYATFLYATLYYLDDLIGQTDHIHAYKFRMYINGNMGPYVQANTHYMEQFIPNESSFQTLCSQLQGFLQQQQTLELEGQM